MLCGVPFPLFFDTVLNSDLWVETICNSTYFESVLNVKVPTMTSNTEPSGEAFSKTYLSDISAYPWKAFDGDVSTIWTGAYNYNSNGEYIGYIFTTPINVRKILIESNSISSDTAKLRVTSFKLQASNDGFSNNIDDLLEVTSRIDHRTEHVINNDKYCTSYRILFTQDGNANSLDINTIQFYGR